MNFGLHHVAHMLHRHGVTCLMKCLSRCTASGIHCATLDVGHDAISSVLIELCDDACADNNGGGSGANNNNNNNNNSRLPSRS